MISAAGIVVISKGLGLFLKRSTLGDHAGEWCFPGGKIEDGESPLEAAIRETEEEAGLSLLETDVQSLMSRCANEVEFTTFHTDVAEPFNPVLNDEHVAWAWAPLDFPPEPLHPGCRGALTLLTGNELDVARAISLGDLPSPQKYKNVYLWDIRITGTGLSYRASLDEYVIRDPSVYLNEDFLARCNGLAVIWYHAKTGHLTSDEYAKRSVGSIFVPYIKGDEVWGVAKVYDDELNAFMLDKSNEVSTSPMVTLGPDDNLKLEAEDGRRILIEGDKPALLDHIAILPNAAGVWDKGGPMAGVARGVVQPNIPEASPEGMADALIQIDASLGVLSLRMSVLAHRRAQAVGIHPQREGIKNG